MTRPLPWISLLLPLASLVGGESDGLAGMFRPEIRPFTLGVSAQGEREPYRENDDGAGFGRTLWRGSVVTQVWHDEQNEVTAGFRGSHQTLETAGTLPRTGEIPDHLYEGYLTTSYRHISAEHWITGATIQAGGAGDRLSARDAGAINATAFVRMPTNPEDGWIFLVSYANNRSQYNNVPFPGVAYQWVRGRELNVTLGAPFTSVFWRPTSWSDLLIIGTPFGFAKAGAGVNPLPSFPLLRTGVSFDWTTEAYRRIERTEPEDVLFLRETRLTGSIGVNAGPTIGADLYAGWVFTRQFREANSYNEAGNNRLEVAPGPVFGMNARFRF